jgi:hypothetical protein
MPMNAGPDVVTELMRRFGKGDRHAAGDLVAFCEWARKLLDTRGKPQHW